jgi:hypothetical protein
LRISKVTRWALTVGLFAILLVTGSVAYGRQQAVQRELSSAINKATQDLVKYSAQKKELETRLQQANANIAAAQSEFRRYPGYLEVVEALLDTAEDARVTITSFASSPPGAEKSGGVDFTVYTFSLTVEGEVLPSLLLFNSKLGETFPTASIKSVQIRNGEKAEMVLELKVHAYTQ